MLDTYNKSILPRMNEESNEITLKPIDISVHGKRASWCTQFSLLLSRNLANMKRNPVAYKARIFNGIFMAMIAMMIFYQVNGGSLKNQVNLAGAMFFCSVNHFMLPF